MLVINLTRSYRGLVFYPSVPCERPFFGVIFISPRNLDDDGDMVQAIPLSAIPQLCVCYPMNEAITLFQVSNVDDGAFVLIRVFPCPPEAAIRT